MYHEKVHEKTRRTVCYGVRIDQETYALAMAVARSRGMDLADLIRELLRRELARLSYLSPEDKKALGYEVRV